MKILLEIGFFSVREGRGTRGHDVTLAKEQCRLDIRMFVFSQRTVNEWNIYLLIVLVMEEWFCLNINITHISIGWGTRI